jgi:nitrite reductase/ring-hydroxylating ferredoxin subunit
VLARTAHGHAAFDDRCTHKGGPLSDGALACGTVQCPWHGSQFNVSSGDAIHGPAKDAIGIYAAEERDGLVWITLPAPALRSAFDRAL